MNHNLGTERVNKLLWQLSIPAILGMLSSAIFNIVDRIFVGKIDSYALTAVGITMPIQILQMAFILLIGIGTSALIAIKLGEGKKEEAEEVLYLALKYIVIFLIGFAILFVAFLDPILGLLAISKEVYPYAKEYIVILIVGAIIGIPGYCLNNSLRSIGQARTSMQIIVATSILNIILDPLFIFGLKLGIAGAAIATVISQTTLTVYVIYVFCKRKDFVIRLRLQKAIHEKELFQEIIKMGLPSFFVQILATIVNVIINNSLLYYGNDMDVAAITIMSSVFSFYNMVVVGIVQGNNAICGFNYGARQYDRVRKSLSLAICYAFTLSTILFLLIWTFPHLIVDVFTKDIKLANITATGMRYYFCMLPIVGIQTVSAQYFQSVGKAKRSSMLAFLRYGFIIIPSIFILAPRFGVNGIYVSNAISDGIAASVAIGCIWFERNRLYRLDHSNEEVA